MRKLSRRGFLALCGKAVVLSAVLSAVPGADTISDAQEATKARKATDEQARVNLQSHTLPDFETWMLSTAF